MDTFPGTAARVTGLPGPVYPGTVYLCTHQPLYPIDKAYGTLHGMYGSQGCRRSKVVPNVVKAVQKEWLKYAQKGAMGAMGAI